MAHESVRPGGAGVALDRISAVPAGAAVRVGHTVITEWRLVEVGNMMRAPSGQPSPTDKPLLAPGYPIGATVRRGSPSER